MKKATKIYAQKQIALMRTMVLQRMAKARKEKSCMASISRIEMEFGGVEDEAFQKKVEPIIKRIYTFIGAKNKEKAMLMLEKETLNLLAIFKEEGIK